MVAPRQQDVKVVLIQTLAFQQGDILVEESIQRELHGVFGIVVLGDIQPKPALIGFQIGQDRPVFRIALLPDHAPVLQFSKRLQVIRAIFDSPQVLAADAR